MGGLSLDSAVLTRLAGFGKAFCSEVEGLERFSWRCLEMLGDLASIDATRGS